MIVQKIKTQLSENRSFSIRVDHSPRYHNSWHYHEEIELIFIVKGRGTYYIGDCIKNFKEGDLIIIGSNIPHYWLFDDDYFDGSQNYKIEVFVLHFRPSLFSSDFLLLPENKFIFRLLSHSKKSIKLTGFDEKQVLDHFGNLASPSNQNHVLSLLTLLQDLTHCQHEALISQQYAKLSHFHEQEKLNKVFEFLRLNFKSKVTLEEVSEIAGLTNNSFCRYFKTNTGKTFIEFLIDIRINYACKLLSESNAPIKEILYSSGFSNSVSFHKKFKELTGMTPTEYRKVHKLV